MDNRTISKVKKAWLEIRREKWGVTLWIVLNALDMMLTIGAQNLGATELLPVARALIEWRAASFVLFKVAASFLVPLLLYLFQRFKLLRTLNMLLGMVVLWNVLLCLFIVFI